MDINKLILDIAGLAGGGVIIVTAGYFLVRPDIHRYLRLKSAEVKKEERPQLLMLRLQAHERLILFIERINPTNLLIRLHYQGISLADMQSILLNEIRFEYQHNVAQQLYVSPLIWDVVSKLKEDTLAMINNAVRNLPADAEGVDLSKKILQHMAASAENPYDLTLTLIKKDIQELF
ncbi:hypothetical protein [Pedobacter ginsengisoli]|uniref:DUF7935 family protein n=1 Tax=Pedobacter ginsengisoli TaxID=363852 RepID=UPI00254D6511|nr:hypothetical protein [Pedobacter ginsengisoli]